MGATWEDARRAYEGYREQDERAAAMIDARDTTGVPVITTLPLIIHDEAQKLFPAEGEWRDGGDGMLYMRMSAAAAYAATIKTPAPKPFIIFDM